MATTSTEDCGRRFFRWGQKAYRKEGEPHYEWDSNPSPRRAGASSGDVWHRQRPRPGRQDRILELVGGFLGTTYNTRTAAACDSLRYTHDPVGDSYFQKLFARLRAERLRTEFTALAAQWRSETGFLSSSDDKFLHSAYQSIIAMGEAAVPLVLEELELRRGHWFWALHFMAKADPVPEGANVDQAREAWMEWGRDNGYLK